MARQDAKIRRQNKLRPECLYRLGLQRIAKGRVTSHYVRLMTSSWTSHQEAQGSKLYRFLKLRHVLSTYATPCRLIITSRLFDILLFKRYTLTVLQHGMVHVIKKPTGNRRVQAICET